jgi:hypothetical protein
MAGRNIKARYHTTYLGKQPVTYNKCRMVKEEGAEVPTMQHETVTEEKECWLVRFPQGHSIRITDRKDLERQGYHLRPRMVDMETGDVVNLGGDPYDFGSPDDSNIILEDDAEMPSRRKVKTADATA